MRVRSTLSLSLGGFVVAAVFAAPQASAQADAASAPLKFEVASIKVATSGINGVRGGCRGVDSVYSPEEQARGGIPSLGRCVITDARLSHLIGIAYGVSMQVLDTGPDGYNAETCGLTSRPRRRIRPRPQGSSSSRCCRTFWWSASR